MDNQDEEGAAVQVSRVFEGLGAPPAQALVMARQLIRRAGQLSAQENIPFLQSLERLLHLATRGAQGDFDPN